MSKDFRGAIGCADSRTDYRLAIVHSPSYSKTTTRPLLPSPTFTVTFRQNRTTQALIFDFSYTRSAQVIVAYNGRVKERA